MSHLIAITGGIGSGKSVVSHLLRCNSFTVYDCDREAKRLMDNNTDIHAQLNRHIHPRSVTDGIIDRKLIADIVFTDPGKLTKLNSIVHSAVIDDIRHITVDSLPNRVMFIETAILYQSNIDLMVDSVWVVTAPLEVRVARVMRRNSCTRDEVISRIKSQDSFLPPRRHNDTRLIVNDDITPLLPQVMDLIKTL